MTTNTNPHEESTMTTGRMAELAEWWKTAERGSARKGDVVIEKVSDEQYNTFIAFEDDDQEYDEFRILERAPQPKPAWCDAVAVWASSRNQYVETRTVWKRKQRGWISTEGDVSAEDELIDPIPLIEARVTDEMVERGRNIGVRGRKPDAEMVRRILSSAFGLKTY